MTTSVSSKKPSAQSSPSQIIATFNNFFAAIPANKSFDMSYKAYIQDLADVEERLPLSARSSSTNMTPVTIASYGNQAALKRGTTAADLRDTSGSSSLSSSATPSLTSLSTKTSEASCWKRALSQADRIYEDNKLRKERSMVNLAEFNKALGLPFVEPPPASKSTADTIYENLTVKDDEDVGGGKTFAEKKKTTTQHEFGKAIKSTPSADALFFKIADCFD